MPVTLSPVRSPRAPSGYAVPRNALRVSSSAQLENALADGRTETIVLSPGVYDAPRPFADREGDRILASRLGRAVLRAGFVLGGNNGPPGALIRGLTFSVRDPRKTLDGDVVHVWGSAASASVLDTRIDGHGMVDAGIVVHQPRGFVARRIAPGKEFRGPGTKGRSPTQSDGEAAGGRTRNARSDGGAPEAAH